MLPFTLQQLHILKTVVNEKNFTKASEVLYLSQPSLSKQIKNLEKNLGVLIINREDKKISLTDNGKILLHYSDRILALCEESCRTLTNFQNKKNGDLILGVSQTIGTYLMPKILILLTQNYSQVSLKLHINSTKIITKNVRARKLDVALVEGKITDRLKNTLIIEEFVSDELNLIISRAHPFAQKRKIKKEDLYCLDFITLSSNSTIRNVINNTLLQNGIETHQLKTVLELNSIESIKTAVSLGLGAAFVSSSTIEKELQLQTLKVIQIENIRIKKKLYLISTFESSKLKAFKIFYEELIRLKSKL